MRSFFYLQLQERLEQLPDRQGVPAVRTYDLWNEQVDFIEEEEPFDMPAVFLEFMPYKWTTLSGAVQQAAVTVRLHVVTPGKARQGREADTSSSPWNVSACWRRSAPACMISRGTTGRSALTCSGVQPAIQTIIMRRWWRMWRNTRSGRLRDFRKVSSASRAAGR